MNSIPKSGFPRSRSLDALRGIAILLVLGRHTEVSELWTKIGWCGVDLFFVLSGFLISGLLFHEFKRYGDIQLKTFWLRRGLKIYPGYYLCTIVQTVAYWAMFGKYPGVRSPMHVFLIDATFLSSYFEGVSGHTWSLAIEEHFYFLLPVLLLILIKLRAKTQNPFSSIPAIFVLIAVGSLSLRIAAKPTGLLDYYTYLLPTHLRMDALFCGVTIGYLYHFKPQMLSRIARWPLLAAGGVLLVPIYYMNLEYWHMYTWGLTTTFLGFACIVTWAVHADFKAGRALSFPIELLARIGFYSYSIYLWHWILIYYLRPYIRRLCMTTGSPMAWSSTLQFWQWPVCIGLSISVGILMAIVVEQPVLRLRERWFPSRSSSSGPSCAPEPGFAANAAKARAVGTA